MHAGVDPDPVTGAILTPIHQTTTFVQPSVDEYMSTGFSYCRSGNPTVRAFETKIADLEDGVGRRLPSPPAWRPPHAVFIALLNAGDHVVVSDVAYGGTHRLATQIFPRFGVEVDFVDTADPGNVERALRPTTRLVFTETPANPTLKLADLVAISEITRAAGIPHAVDNTFLSPYYQQPLALGADLVVHSTTKYLDGHNATVGGAVVSGPGRCTTDRLRPERHRHHHVADGGVAHHAGRQDPGGADGSPVGRAPWPSPTSSRGTRR